MSDQNSIQPAANAIVSRNDVDGVLSSNFYCDRPPSAPQGTPPARNQKPTHYKVICISLYNDDLKRLDDMVDTLKSRGMTKANRSALIRYALGEVDLESVPRGL